MISGGLAAGFAQGFNLVAQLGGSFIILARRRIAHIRLQQLDHFSALALKKFTGIFNLHAILLLTHLADTRCAAHLDMPVKTVFMIALRWLKRLTTPKVKPMPRQIQRTPQGATTGERPEVTGTIIHLEPSECKTRNRVIEIHLEHQKTFVVPKTHIIARLVFLDQPTFQQQCLRLALDEVHIKIMNGIDECSEFHIPTHPTRGMKILTHAFSKITRFSNINHRAETVLHEVHAGLVRQLTDFAPDGFGGRHTDSLLHESRIFHEGVADHVCYSHLAILSPTVMGFLHHNAIISNPGERATFTAN